MAVSNRQAYLAALGLTDWQYRADGPLARRAVADQAQATTVADAAATEPAASTAVEPDRCAASDSAAGTPDSDSSSPKQTEPLALEESALAAMDWDALEAHLASCDHRGAQRPVFGVGARDAQVLIVGEAPGAQEDEQGVPFVGRAGQLLDRMLFAIGCARETNVYITNICKFRPPNNRDPLPEEVAADWPVLERQIDLMQPRLVVAVGRVAAQTLLESRENLGALRGRLHRYPRRELDVLVTYHPAYLLRSPQAKAKAWDDLKRIAAHIEAAGQTA